MVGPALPPSHLNVHRCGPSPSPSVTSFRHQTRSAVYFSPPLIAMVVVIATAFLLVAYYRRLYPPFHRLWRRCRRHRSYPASSSLGDVESQPPPLSELIDDDGGDWGFRVYGLDDAVIKAIPLSVYASRCCCCCTKECAVCLVEFEDRDRVRTLPVCAHSFHDSCIDVWLRSHANCPLCRALVFPPNSPFVPVMAARIRPTTLHDDAILLTEELATAAAAAAAAEAAAGEVVAEEATLSEEDHQHEHQHQFLLKRSYSFGFERSFPSERVAAAMTSPWRYRRGSLWSKRASPLGKPPRVFSLRYYRGMKSPFFRRRRSSGGGGLLFPLSERYAGGGGGGGGSSSRRSKSMTSPMFARPMGFPSTRLQCRDLEALLSPDR